MPGGDERHGEPMAIAEWALEHAHLIDEALSIMNVGLYLQHYAGDYVRWSPQLYRIFGFDETKEITGERFLEALHPEDQPRIMAAASKVHSPDSTAESYTVPFRIKRADGQIRFLEATGFPHRDAHGRVVLELGVTRDVTDAHLLNSRVLASQRLEMVGLLAGGIAHDFNNLLTAIIGEAEVALLSAKAPEQRQPLEAIVETSMRTVALTRQLLTFTRRRAFRLRVVDLNELAGSMTRLLRRLLRDDISLTMNLTAGQLPVRIDAGQIEQVLVNLVINAGEAIEGGGTVTVSTRHSTLPAGPDDEGGPRQAVDLVVEDDGPGIAADVLPEIFEPFFTTKEQGTGLGLATCRDIVLKSGGDLTASSEPSGSSFVVSLPAELSDKPVRLTGVVEPAQRIGADSRVLVVDDERAVGDSVGRQLQALGHDVEVVITRSAALQRASEVPRVDVIVCDMRMPGLTLADFVTQLAAQTPSLPVLLMSGDPDSTITPELRALASAPIAFIAKPFNAAQLVAAVRALRE